MSSVASGGTFGFVSWLNDLDWQKIAIATAVGFVFLLIFYLFGRQIIQRYKELRDELDS